MKFWGNFARRQALAGALAGYAISFLGSGASCAATMRIEPVLLEIFAPGAATTLTLHNDGDSEVSVQVRVFRWVQSNGKETLEPTRDVVASPPLAKLGPRSENVVRVVRMIKRPLEAEESYRIFVDQLPQRPEGQTHQIEVLIRQSIPVFFSPRPGETDQLSWSFAYEDGELVAVARNNGARRLRVSALSAGDSQGRKISFGQGLLGYVLSRSTMKWPLPKSESGFGSEGPITIDAQSDRGPIRVVVPSPSRS
jgi:fimbrial chaperone protein